MSTSLDVSQPRLAGLSTSTSPRTIYDSRHSLSSDQLSTKNICEPPPGITVLLTCSQYYFFGRLTFDSPSRLLGTVPVDPRIVSVVNLLVCQRKPATSVVVHRPPSKQAGGLTHATPVISFAITLEARSRSFAWLFSTHNSRRRRSAYSSRFSSIITRNGRPSIASQTHPAESTSPCPVASPCWIYVRVLQRPKLFPQSCISSHPSPLVTYIRAASLFICRHADQPADFSPSVFSTQTLESYMPFSLSPPLVNCFDTTLPNCHRHSLDTLVFLGPFSIAVPTRDPKLCLLRPHRH